MPYKSKAQQGKFHAMEARGEITPSTVKEFDKATKGKFELLPEHVAKKPHKKLKDTMLAHVFPNHKGA